MEVMKIMMVVVVVVVVVMVVVVVAVVVAHTPLVTTRASPTLMDGEFHFNAAEWVQRTHQIQV